MKFQYNDGGRAAAGYKGVAGDCVVRAIAIATDQWYRDVYAAVNELGKQERPSKRRKGRSTARNGVHKHTIRAYLTALGWQWRPLMGIGTGCRVHLRDGELPMGRLICQLSKHIVAVIDGVVHDTYQDDRGGTRCVYGYWFKPKGVTK